MSLRKKTFWCALTRGSEYHPSRAKASWIRNPRFRYVHSNMSNTLFGHGESDGGVRQSELQFLWNMVHP